MPPPGTKPKSAALNKLQGNPGKRPLNKQEPKPSGDLTRPQWLLPEAKLEWNRIIKAMENTGVITAVDRGILATYCQLWARFVEGEQSSQPLNAALIAQMRMAMSELGLTPSARTRLSAEPPKDDDPFEALLKGSQRQN